MKRKRIVERFAREWSGHDPARQLINRATTLGVMCHQRRQGCRNGIRVEHQLRRSGRRGDIQSVNASRGLLKTLPYYILG